MCPVPIPINMHKPADKELREPIEAGVLEICYHHTPWLSIGLLMSKKLDPKPEGPKCRLVTDLSPVNGIKNFLIILMKEHSPSSSR